MSKIEYQDIIAFHPGYYLREIVEDMEITQDEFAKRLNTTPKTFSKLLSGQIPISDEIALKLSIMLGTSVDLWLNLQTKYDEKCIEIEKKKELEKEKKYISMIDYKYFVRLNAVADVDDRDERVRNLCKFLKISSLSVLSQDDFLVNFRNNISNPSEKNKVNSKAWLQTVINFGKQIEVDAFDKKKLTESLPTIRKLTTKRPSEFYPKLVKIFSSCGVSFVILPLLSSSGIHGAVKWINKDKVILAMNDRLKYADVFWFSLFHEIQHVLQQKIKKTIIISDKLDVQLEEEADSFARDILIPPQKYNEFLSEGIFTENAIKAFAESIEIDPCIVLGRLQKENLVPYSWLNSLKKKYEIIVG
jgi:addiction module HigA family antidote